VPDGAEVSRAERETWLGGMTLVADAAQRKIRFVPDAEAETGPRLPVGKVLGSAFGGGRSYEFAGPLLDRCNESEFNWVMDEVPNAVRSARVVVTTLERASLAGAREAFAHICRAGQPISEEDFEAALAWQPGRP